MIEPAIADALEAHRRFMADPALVRAVESGAAASTVKQYKRILRHLYMLSAQEEISGRKIFEGISPVQGLETMAARLAEAREAAVP